ncbi:serum amyloid P-component [Marmota flaviventris]|uniref:serum amyloid P-component n=1 Tax=Marmota flaviventris TaxID=93162 RepID=UPI000FFFB33A|nr:serum amyloid P-component [Marmota flaviventris]
MDKLLFWVSVLTSLQGTFAQTDLRGKVFVFPRESSSDHVNVIAEVKKPLQNLTLCLRAYSDLSRAYSLFSYNAQGKDNELLIYKEKAGQYNLYIGRSKVTAKVVEDPLAPVHICTSWESSTGIAEFWINGKPLVKKGLKQGYSVEPHPKIVLGQEQDSYGGSFDKSQSFVGEIADLYLWDTVLSPEEIQLVYQDSPPSPNILNWRDLNYEVNGYVVTKPRVWDSKTSPGVSPSGGKFR